jgi:hypothetical protein
MRNACIILAGKPEGKWPRDRPVKFDLGGSECEYLNWICVARDTVRWRALSDEILNPREP